MYSAWYFYVNEVFGVLFLSVRGAIVLIAV